MTRKDQSVGHRTSSDRKIKVHQLNFPNYNRRNLRFTFEDKFLESKVADFFGKRKSCEALQTFF